MSSSQSVPSTYKVFMNLPIQDQAASIRFYTSIGFVQNKTFSGEDGVMMSLPIDADAPEDVNPINVMLLRHKFFDTFLPSTHVRATTHPITPVQTSCLNCLASPSKTAVDSLLGRVQAAGGNIDIRPPQQYANKGEEDQPWMYGRSFTDLDGHIWEVMFMDVDRMPKRPE